MKKNKIARMTAKMTPKEYIKNNPDFAIAAGGYFAFSIFSASLALLRSDLFAIEGSYMLFIFGMFMLICGVADAKVKSKARTKKILPMAARVYINDIMDNEVQDIDNTKPLLKDHKEVLSNKKSVQNLSNHLFDSLRESEQKEIAKILRKMFNVSSNKLRSSDLKVAIDGIVNILKGHDHVHNESIPALYSKMLSKAQNIATQQAQNTCRK